MQLPTKPYPFPARNDFAIANTALIVGNRGPRGRYLIRGEPSS
ncbi:MULTISPECIES: hypothetical protein [Ciceribacter]|nr:MULTISPECIES: hypothetical protein [unclassified Ciceribacter]